MSGTYPSSPVFSTMTLGSVQQTFVDRSQSGKRFARKTTGHYWTVKATYDTLTKEQFWPIFGFAIGQDGDFGTFSVVLPDLATPKGTANGTPKVKGGSQSGTTLLIDGCTPSQSAFLKPGDIFKVTGDSKVYMVISTIAANSSGEATLSFRPPLEKVPADNADITVTNVDFTMAFSGPVREYSVQPPLIYDFEVNLVEAV